MYIDVNDCSEDAIAFIHVMMLVHSIDVAQIR